VSGSKSRKPPATAGAEDAAAGLAPVRLAPLAPDRSFDVLFMLTFVTLGLPEGMIGTAWPTLRHSFHAPLADLGLYLVVVTVGYVSSSSVSGLVLARLGVRPTILLGAAAAALGALGMTVAPSYWAFVLPGVAIGLAGGLWDSAVNTSMALAGRNRLLNFLHGCFGVGTSLGPLIITAAVLVGSWRTGYAALVVVEMALLTGWWVTGRRPSALPASAFPGPEPVAPGPGPIGPDPIGPDPIGPDPIGPDPIGPAPVGPATAGPGPSPDADAEGIALQAAPVIARSRARLVGVVGLGLVVFMVYVGFEAGAGQWEPSFDRGPLHLGAGATGLATAGYWGALTVVRIALAVPRRPLPPQVVVRWGCAVALAAAVFVWWRPSTVVALVGLTVIGGACAGVFPALVTLTPRRVGEDIAHHVIGWQIGAASLGGSVISAVFGVIFQHLGLKEFGPALVGVGTVLMVGVLLLERTGPEALARPLAC
jgi:fucose permease